MLKRLLHFSACCLIALLPTIAAGQETGGIDTAGIYVATYHGDRRAAIVYTFDDGLLEHYTMVFPELKKRGLKATFGIVGSKVGGDMKGTRRRARDSQPRVGAPQRDETIARSPAPRD